MYTQAQNKASQKYNKKAYDVITYRVQKGKREELQSKAEKKGLSLNQYITNAIEIYEKM